MRVVPKMTTQPAVRALRRVILALRHTVIEKQRRTPRQAVRQICNPGRGRQRDFGNEATGKNVAEFGLDRQYRRRQAFVCRSFGPDKRFIAAGNTQLLHAAFAADKSFRRQRIEHFVGDDHARKRRWQLTQPTHACGKLRDRLLQVARLALLEVR